MVMLIHRILVNSPDLNNLYQLVFILESNVIIRYSFMSMIYISNFHDITCIGQKLGHLGYGVKLAPCVYATAHLTPVIHSVVLDMLMNE